MSSQSGSIADATTCYVRVRGRKKRFIEIDFAVGAPELAVEMLIPESMFEEFCRKYSAVRLDAEEGNTIDIERAQWRYGTMDVDTDF